MRIQHVLVSLAVTTLVLSCTKPLPPPPDLGRYSCLELPSGFERPGTLIRRTGAGQLFLVADLFTQQQRENEVFKEANVQSAAARRSGSNAGSLAIGLLEKLKPGVTAGVAATAKQQWDGNVVYTGLDEERTFDEPIHDLSRRWVSANRMLEGSEYFLIRDALRARSVTMDLSQQRANDLKLDAVFQAAANASANSAFDRGAVYRLSSQLDPPLYVCITQERIEQIAPAGAPGGGVAGQSVITFTPVPGGDFVPPIQR